jgi:hypothetical protein
MFISATVKKWVILTPKDCYTEVYTFAKNLAKAGQGMSFILPKPDM